MANATRQVEATLKQIEAIKKLKAKKVFDSLKKDLKETAESRIIYQDDTLSELADRLQVTKSCLNHRLRKILKLAEEL